MYSNSCCVSKGLGVPPKSPPSCVPGGVKSGPPVGVRPPPGVVGVRDEDEDGDAEAAAAAAKRAYQFIKVMKL